MTSLNDCSNNLKSKQPQQAEESNLSVELSIFTIDAGSHHSIPANKNREIVEIFNEGKIGIRVINDGDYFNGEYAIEVETIQLTIYRGAEARLPFKIGAFNEPSIVRIAEYAKLQS